MHLTFMVSYRFSDPKMHEIALCLLEYFEVIYRMRTGSEQIDYSTMNEEQIFFIPSLLSTCETSHPSLDYWNRIEPKYV